MKFSSFDSMILTAFLLSIPIYSSSSLSLGNDLSIQCGYDTVCNVLWEVFFWDSSVSVSSLEHWFLGILHVLKTSQAFLTFPWWISLWLMRKKIVKLIQTEKVIGLSMLSLKRNRYRRREGIASSYRHLV